MNYPEKIGSFENTEGKEFFFSSCDSCGARCCTGKENFVLAPLILEDFELVYKHFPIVFRAEEGKVKASILLNNGKSGCWYLQDDKCQIYNERPPTCKQYPISPYFDTLYIDRDCPAVSSEDGIPLVKDLKISDSFKIERFENFKEKLEKTQEAFSSLDPNSFTKILTVAGVDLFVYTGESYSQLINFHKRSINIHEKLLISALE